MAVKFYLEKRASAKTKECPIRASFSIKGVTLITTTGISINEANWYGDKADEEKNKNGRRKYAEDYQNAKKQSCADINLLLKKIRLHFDEWELSLEDKPTKEEIKQHLRKALSKKEPEKTIPVKVKRVSLLERLDEFTTEESAANGWAFSTLQIWKTFKKHLIEFDPKVKFETFNESGINRFVIFLRNQDLEEKSVLKHFSNLRWFLYWAIRKGYTQEDTIKRYRPKIKVLQKPVIFLTKEELLHLYNFKIPGNGVKVKLLNDEDKEEEQTLTEAGALVKTRDLFCFCAFTSLRYSDMAALKRTDIDGDTMYITTQKTNDRLPINLNKYAKEILAKYEDKEFPDNLALPVISNQKMNSYLKTLCDLAGIHTPVTVVCIRGGQRVETTRPKCKLIGTHAGRRTFICFALSSGIPPQVVMKWTGHSDYKAMKPYIDIAEKTTADAMKLFEEEMSK